MIHDVKFFIIASMMKSISRSTNPKSTQIVKLPIMQSSLVRMCEYLLLMRPNALCRRNIPNSKPPIIHTIIVTISAKFNVIIARIKVIAAITPNAIIPLTQVTQLLCKKILIANILAVRFPANKNTTASSVLASNHPTTQHSLRVKNT